MNTKLLDPCRIIAAILVIAIHTSPLESFSETGDFLLTRCIARTAVPFFFMLTGYFLMPPRPREGLRACQAQSTQGSTHLGRPGRRALLYKNFVCREKKLFLIYFAAILLYLPLNIYSGQWDLSHPVKWLFFDGTFYHLWYLPAAILGLALVFLLTLTWSCFLRRWSARRASWLCLVLSLILYIPGLLGDSYYGCIQNIPALKAVYDFLFGISSYTRNGLFFAPVFISLGWFIRNHPPRIRRRRQTFYGIASLALLSGLIVEALALRSLLWQRHDSMYILLPPLMYFLFRFLLCLSQWAENRTNRPLPESPGHPVPFAPAKRYRGMRPSRHVCPKRCPQQNKGHSFYSNIALIIYIIHPWVIVLVRGFAKLSGLEPLLVHQSFIFFFAVTFVSCILSVILWKIKRYSLITAFTRKFIKRR